MGLFGLHLPKAVNNGIGSVEQGIGRVFSNQGQPNQIPQQVNPGAIPKNSPMLANPVNIHPAITNHYSGTMLGVHPLSQSSLAPPMAIDPATTPKAMSIFAPMNKDTQQLVNRASDLFGYTPQFKNVLNSAQPQAFQQDSLDGGQELKKGVRAAGFYAPAQVGPSSNNREIALTKGYGSSPQVITHEGLHAAWDALPQTRQDFTKAYQASLSPQVIRYLDQRLGGYSNYKGPQTLSKLSSLSPDIQTEIHSFLSEAPFQQPLSGPLQKYYSRYINVNQAPKKAMQKYLVRRSIEKALDPQQYQMLPLGLQEDQ